MLQIDKIYSPTYTHIDVVTVQCASLLMLHQCKRDIFYSPVSADIIHHTTEDPPVVFWGVFTLERCVSSFQLVPNNMFVCFSPLVQFTFTL